MALRVAILGVLFLTGSAFAKGVLETNKICEQCKDTLSTIQAQVLTALKSTTPKELTSTVCNFDDAQLHRQCHELFNDNADEFVGFLENVDVSELCEATLCTDDMDVKDDYRLYFQAENGATRTDEVGGFACSICRRFMALIHHFLTSRSHQGFVLHMLKGVCHFVPLFKTECELLINMYGRLIINLAARYLSPQLCTTFHLCPAQLPSSCVDVLKFNRKNVESGSYLIYNAKKEPFTVHCSFQPKYVLTYISTNTNVTVDLSKLYNNKKQVVIRYRNTNDQQFETQLGQITAFKNTPLSVQYSANEGYAAPQNKAMKPFLYLGFIPINQSRKGLTEGYSTNGKDNTFTNCDGNPNSYFTFLFNHKALNPVKYGPFDSPLMHAWEKAAKPIPINKHIPCEYFSFYEIHFGGCGGYATIQQFPNVNGAALGLRFDMPCDEPKDITDGTNTFLDTSVGSTVEYSCNHGYYMAMGDAKRVCGQDGQWTGEAPICLKEVTLDTSD